MPLLAPERERGFVFVFGLQVLLISRRDGREGQEHSEIASRSDPVWILTTLTYVWFLRSI